MFKNIKNWSPCDVLRNIYWCACCFKLDVELENGRWSKSNADKDSDGAFVITFNKSSYHKIPKGLHRNNSVIPQIWLCLKICVVNALCGHILIHILNVFRIIKNIKILNSYSEP